jgi:hypothetical protein
MPGAEALAPEGEPGSAEISAGGAGGSVGRGLRVPGGVPDGVADVPVAGAGRSAELAVGADGAGCGCGETAGGVDGVGVGVPLPGLGASFCCGDGEGAGDSATWLAVVAVSPVPDPGDTEGDEL